MDKEVANALLLEAAYIGDIANVQKALDAGADVNTKDKIRATPLHFAAFSGSTEIVKLLVEHGANVNALSMFNKTPSDWAFEKGHIRTTVQQLDDIAEQQQSHAGRVDGERKDKGPPQVGG